MNVGHPEGQDDLEKVLAATIAEALPHVMRYPIEDTNTLLVASASPLSADRLRSAVPDLRPRSGRRRSPPPAASRLRSRAATSTPTTGRPWNG